jgi:hypothetical protein
MGMPRSVRIVGYVLLCVLLVVTLGLSLDRPSGPVERVSGVVESSTFIQEQYGPAYQRVAVRLSDGNVVHATVAAPGVVRSGQTTDLRVRHTVFTRRPVYEIVGVAAQ